MKSKYLYFNSDSEHIIVYFFDIMDIADDQIQNNLLNNFITNILIEDRSSRVTKYVLYNLLNN